LTHASLVWSVHPGDSGVRGTLRFAVLRKSEPATYRDVIDAWRTDPGFCAWLNDVLAGAPFHAFRWETPAVTTSTVDRPFEMVLVDSPGLDRTPDPDAFADHLERATSEHVVTFSNLGGDATLVVPRHSASPSAYGHIAAFVRGALEAQRLALWRAVGDAMSRRLGSKPVWLSTAGAGVPWLHVRLDDRPKYYGYTPFRESPRP